MSLTYEITMTVIGFVIGGGLLYLLTRHKH